MLWRLGTPIIYRIEISDNNHSLPGVAAQFNGLNGFRRRVDWLSLISTEFEHFWRMPRSMSVVRGT